MFFPKPVSEAELVKAARDADIGIIPYEPSSINNRYCSPNKLSQYMAAGLPIICNELDFVKSIVLGNGIGSSVDFNDEAALVRTINDYVLNRQLIPELSRKARQVFVKSFNWQVASRDMYRRIKALVPRNEPSGFNFTWVGETPIREVSALEGQLALIDDERKRYHAEWKNLRTEWENCDAEVARLNKAYPEEIKTFAQFT